MVVKLEDINIKVGVYVYTKNVYLEYCQAVSQSVSNYTCSEPVIHICRERQAVFKGSVRQNHIRSYTHTTSQTDEDVVRKDKQLRLYELKTFFGLDKMCNMYLCVYVV